VVSAAMSLTQCRHSTERVLMAWGGGGAGTVAHAKERMRHILQEYVHTKDVTEAAACLRDLKVPHFHESTAPFVPASCDIPLPARAFLL